MRVAILPALLPAIVYCSAGGPRDFTSGKTDSGAYSLARKVWKGLKKTRNTCGGFDYHPSGGMRSVYCHAKTYTNFAEIASLSGVPVFKSGPHAGNSLDLNNSDFGHYNPEFVRRLADILLPGKTDVVFRKATRPIYDKYLWKLARIHYVTYKKWQNKPTLRRLEIRAYQDYQRKQQASDNNQSGKYGSAFYERFYYFMDPRYTPPAPGTPVWNRRLNPGEFNGNVVKTAAAFWLRRYQDGTVHDFADGLKQLLSLYDPEWFAKNR